ncbi:hypothetical protein Pssp01_31940 [Pseudomonas sp. NBRC 100443]|nr:hypothetical protein Pssp01_31940 [Pseudomonas sp. NBRC 100443]
MAAAAWCSGVSGAVVWTLRVMISLIFMLSSVAVAVGAPSRTPIASDWAVGAPFRRISWIVWGGECGAGGGVGAESVALTPALSRRERGPFGVAE